MFLGYWVFLALDVILKHHFIPRRRRWRKRGVEVALPHPHHLRRLRAQGADRDLLGDGSHGGEAKADRGAGPETDLGVGAKGAPGGDNGGGAAAGAGRTFNAVYGQSLKVIVCYVYVFRLGNRVQSWPQKCALGCVIPPLIVGASSRNLLVHTFLTISVQ